MGLRPVVRGPTSASGREREVARGAQWSIAGLFVAPLPEPGLDALTIETSPMAVALAVGHRLARQDGLAVAAWMGDGLPHPGAITIPLRDGSPVHTRLVWRSADRNANVHALVDLAAAWSALRPDGGDAGMPDAV
jgi:hypothetical protein